MGKKKLTHWYCLYCWSHSESSWAVCKIEIIKKTQLGRTRLVAVSHTSVSWEEQGALWGGRTPLSSSQSLSPLQSWPNRADNQGHELLHSFIHSGNKNTLTASGEPDNTVGARDTVMTRLEPKIHESKTLTWLVLGYLCPECPEPRRNWVERKSTKTLNW